MILFCPTKHYHQPSESRFNNETVDVALIIQMDDFKDHYDSCSGRFNRSYSPNYHKLVRSERTLCICRDNACRWHWLHNSYTCGCGFPFFCFHVPSACLISFRFSYAATLPWMPFNDDPNNSTGMLMWRQSEQRTVATAWFEAVWHYVEHDGFPTPSSE